MIIIHFERKAYRDDVFDVVYILKHVHCTPSQGFL